MKPNPIARRYAKALFELADRDKCLDPIMRQAAVFAQVLTESDQLQSFLFSPLVDRRLKKQALEAALAGKTLPLFYHFILLLLRKGRQQLYQEIVFELGRLYDVRKNRVRASVVSAVALSKEQLEAVRQQLAGKGKSEILIENKVDPEILGGLVINVGGKVLDASLAQQLNRLRRELQQAKLESTIH